MKKLLVALLFSAILFAEQSCKKSTSTGTTTINPVVTPASTAKGTPTGASISKFISSSGGNISTADGRIELDFPSGALPAGDSITIQNITNNGPGGMGNAYRFLPEGLKFTNAVTIKFHYDDSDVNGTIADFLQLSFQDSTGVWNQLDNSTADTTAKILSATTTHFSDWSVFPDLKIILHEGDEQNGQLKVNKSQTYAIWYVPKTSSGQIGEPENIPAASVKNWTINGVINGNSTYGKIVYSSTNANSKWTYTAPAKAPTTRNPVAITAQLDNLSSFHDPKFGSFNSLSLTHNVRIYDVGNGYHIGVSFHAEVNEDGSFYNWNDVGSFDVILSGNTGGSFANISNSNAAVTLDSNTSTCITTLVEPPVGPINIVVDTTSSVIWFSSINTVLITLAALDKNYYIKDAVWSTLCPGGQPTQSGGGLGPPFPAGIEFKAVDSIQTFVNGQYTIVVTPIN
jgi:hypothetical protein